jgi:VanZ family protein
MPPLERRTIRAWLWVMLCVAVILGFSGEAFSAGVTSGYFTRFVHWVWPGITYRQLTAVHVWIRKAAHFTEYAVLAALAFRALRLSLDVPLARVVALSLGLVLAVALTDEARQSVLPTRTGSLADVALDFTGGAAGVLAIVAVHRRLGIGPPLPSEKA